MFARRLRLLGGRTMSNDATARKGWAMKTKLLGLAVGLLAVANTSAADADQYNLTILPGWAFDVNDRGQVVGSNTAANTQPYIWNGGAMVTLLRQSCEPP